MSTPSITGNPPPLSSITGKRKASQAKLDAFGLEINERPHKMVILGFENLSISDCGTRKEKLPPLSLTTGKPLPLNSITEKPVIVRVKRKASQAKLDAFWLEINERPHKMAFLGFENLSISDCGTRKVLNELASKKMLVQHLETVQHSLSVKDVLHSFLQPSRNTKEFKGRSKDRRSLYMPDKDLARSARFEQIWKKRGSIDAEECSLHEKCHLYDVVRVDVEDETHQRVPQSKGAPEVDGAIFDKYLPLLREFFPQAADEIERYKATIEGSIFSTIPNLPMITLFTTYIPSASV